MRSLRTGPRGRSRAGSTAGTGTEQPVTQTPAELVKLVFQTNTVDGVSSVCKGNCIPAYEWVNYVQSTVHRS